MHHLPKSFAMLSSMYLFNSSLTFRFSHKCRPLIPGDANSSSFEINMPWDINNQSRYKRKRQAEQFSCCGELKKRGCRNRQERCRNINMPFCIKYKYSIYHPCIYLNFLHFQSSSSFYIIPHFSLQIHH